jgi:Beta-lactamase superfamily domain
MLAGRHRVDLAAVGAVILSHLHIDHTAGLYGILGRRLQQRIPGELRIYGPPGTRQVVEQISASLTYVDDLMKTDSAAGRLAPTTVMVTEVTEGSVVTAGGATVTATTTCTTDSATAPRRRPASSRCPTGSTCPAVRSSTPAIPGPARTSSVSPPAPTSW